MKERNTRNKQTEQSTKQANDESSKIVIITKIEVII
jgi:hypothetical protein